ncbi:hypothetical protein MTO96_046985, partial [Rhipicephalus appendiculatus]
VCADHFDASFIERTTSYTDQGQEELSKSHCQYRGYFLDLCQRYFPAARPTFQVSDHNTRETPDAKKSRKEASQLAQAVEESLASYEAEQERNRFSSLEELKARLQVVSVSPKWTVIHKEECSMFLNIIDYREPWLNASLTVFENLPGKSLPAIKDHKSRTLVALLYLTQFKK